MKNLLVFAAAIGAVCGVAHAQDADDGLRVFGRLEAGIGFAGDTSFEGSVTGPAGVGTLPFSTDSDLDIGYQAGAALGLANFPLPSWRTEAEALYVSNETDDDTDTFDDVFDTGDEDDDSASADISMYGGFVNLIYDFPLESRFKPYVGGGVGYGRVEVEYDDVGAEDEVFMWQAKAGVSYALSDAATAEVGYRYLKAESADFDADEIDLDVTGEVDNEVHAVTVGVRYAFGG